MRTFLKVLIVLIVLGGLGVGGWVLYNKLFPSYKIVRTFRAGEVWEYQMTTDLTTSMGSGRMTMKLQVATLKTYPDGSADLEYRMTGFTMAGGGQQMSFSEAQLKPLLGLGLRVRATPDGQEQSVQGSSPFPFGGFGSSSSLLYASEHIRKGQEWEKKQSSQGVEVTYKNKLLGMERFNGRDCYQIRTTCTTPDNAQQKIQGTITNYVDRETGWVLRAEGPMQMSVAVGGFTMGMTANVQMVGRRIRGATPSKQPATSTKKNK